MKKRLYQSGWFFLAMLIIASGKHPLVVGSQNIATSSQSEAPKLVVQMGHTSEVRTIAFSPDGKILASGELGEGVIKLWEVATGRELRTLLGGSYAVAFSPDGRTLASAGGHTVKLWDPATGTLLHSFAENSSWFRSVTFSPDGKTLVSTSNDSVVILDTTSGRELNAIPVKVNTNWIVVSPDRKRFASQGAYTNGIDLWDVTTGHKQRTLTSEGSFYSAAFSPDSKLLAAGNRSRISLWNIDTEQELYVLDGLDYHYPLGSENCWALTFNSNGTMLASACNATIKLWDPATGKELRTFNNDSSIQTASSLTFSQDGKLLASGSGSGLISLWNVTTGDKLYSVGQSSVAIKSVAFSPDGKLLASGSQGGGAKLWNMAAGRDLPVFGNYLTYSVAFSPDGRTLVTVGDKVELWETSTGRSLSRQRARGEDSVAFSADGKVIASGNIDGTINLWNATTLQRLRTLKGHTDGIGAVAISADGKTLASGSSNIDRTVRLWDIATGRLRHIFKESIIYPNDMAFDPEGKGLAVRGNGNIKLWEVASGRELRTYSGGEKKLKSVTFSPDGKILAAGCDDGAIKMWEVASGKELPFLSGHTGAVNSVAISPDGKTLASGSEDRTIRLWDLSSGKLIATLINLNKSEQDYAKYVARLKREYESLPDSWDPSLQNNWVILSPDGRFDASSLEEIKGVHWVMPDEPLQTLPLEIFMRDYYEPGLLPRLLAGEEMKPIRKLQTLNRIQPKLSALSVSAPDTDGMVTVTFDVASQSSETQRDPDGKPLVSGVYDVRLFRDGQLVGYTTTADVGADAADEKSLAAWRTANTVELVNGRKTLSFRVALLQMIEKDQVEFSAYAFNADRVKSETTHAEYKLPTYAQVKPKGYDRRAYIVTFGANQNDNPRWNLRFAANDARQLANDLSTRLQASQKFAEVVSLSLISDDETSDGQTYKRREAIKANLKAVMDLLAGKPVSAGHTLTSIQLSQFKKATPNDLVLFAFASHGYSDANGIFYLVPQDAGEVADSGLAEVLKRSISSNELSQWLRDVDTGEMVMIVDACYSASAIQGQGFKPGPMGSRGLGQLAYDKRIRLLAATQADNVALESNKLQHGLLTAALLQDGLKSLSADYLPKDGKIELGEWLNYGVARVPDLYEEIRTGQRLLIENGRAIEPARSRLLVHEERQKSSTQQPTLFDFAHNHRNIFLHQNSVR